MEAFRARHPEKAEDQSRAEKKTKKIGDSQVDCCQVSPGGMGVKVLLCFPFYRRCKERCKDRECPPETELAVPKAEPKPRLCSTASTVSECDSGSNLDSPQAYFSQKARLSFRHQMDSNFNAIDATY